MANKTMYMVSISETSDDYKRPYGSSTSYLAESLEDAKKHAVMSYISAVMEGKAGQMLESEEGQRIFNEMKTVMEGKTADEKKAKFFNSLIEPLYNYFSKNEDELFVGEYVPQCIHITIEKATIAKAPDISASMSELYNAFSEEG